MFSDFFSRLMLPALYCEYSRGDHGENQTGYTLTAYDQFCTKVVMGQNGEAFKKYRLAINRNSKSLKPYQYSGDIEQEYANIKNEVQ